MIRSISARLVLTPVALMVGVLTAIAGFFGPMVTLWGGDGCDGD